MKKIIGITLGILLGISLVSSVIAEIELSGSRFYKGTTTTLNAANYRVETIVTNIDTEETYTVFCDTMNFAAEGTTVIFNSINHGEVK